MRPSTCSMAPRGPATPHPRAFTLVEAIATMTIIAVVMAAVSRIVFAATDGYASTVTRASLSNAASAALDRIAAEIRNIPQRPAADPPEPDVDAVTPASLSWSGTHSLALDGSTLRYTTDGAASILLENVTGLSIRTFDESDAPLAATLAGAACGAVRRVEVTVTVSAAGVSETLRTRVFLRCMAAGTAP